MEALSAAAVLAAVSVPQIMEAGPSDERRAMMTMNVWRWLETLRWMKPRCSNTVLWLTALQNEAISKEVMVFARILQIISILKSPYTIR